MAATIFDYDDKAFKAFARFYSKAPQKARKATARMLTQFAFGTRQEAIKEIKRTKYDYVYYVYLKIFSDLRKRGKKKSTKQY